MKDYADLSMHTAEHLLNQSMVRLFGCGRAFSSHIEKKKSKCDYRFPRDLTAEERTGLEELVNGAIQADLPVSEVFVPLAEAREKFDLARLPAAAAGSSLRVIKVGDFDACPCIGSHAASTGEIGVFRIISTGFAEGVLRIRFRLGE